MLPIGNVVTKAVSIAFACLLSSYHLFTATIGSGRHMASWKIGGPQPDAAREAQSLKWSGIRRIQVLSIEKLRGPVPGIVAELINSGVV